MPISKVLVVDDSEIELLKIERILSNAGYTVFIADNGEQAIKKAKEENPDIIFMDIVMPDMNGYETTRKLSNDSETRDIPVIFVSSKDESTDKLWAEMQGGKGYITKPYTSDKIIEKLEAFS